jgi:hypothetical protein
MHWEEKMLGLMQDWSLLLHKVLNYVTLHYGEKEVVGRSSDVPEQPNHQTVKIRRSTAIDRRIVEAGVCGAPISEQNSVAETDGRLPMHGSAELARTYSDFANAVMATALNAQAGLNWLSVQSPNLEEVRQSLDSIANDGKRVAELIVRLQELTKIVRTPH